LRKNGLDADVQVLKISGVEIETVTTATFPLADRMAVNGDTLYVLEVLDSTPRMRTVHFDGKALSTIALNGFAHIPAPDTVFADPPYLIVTGAQETSAPVDVPPSVWWFRVE
jgi:hypothetical protein